MTMNLHGKAKSSIVRAVDAAFLILEIVPREHQRKTCISILEGFSNKKKHIILNAPTGSGKSIIGAVVSTATSILLRQFSESSVIVTATNVLAKQYQKDFKEDNGFCFIYGANRYTCELKDNLFNKPGHTSDECYKKSRFFYMKYEVDGVVQEPDECKRCEFAKSRQQKKSSNFAITNYSYFILDRLYIRALSEKSVESGGYPINNFTRPLYIFDEAHLLNELFVNHCAIFINEKKAKEYIADIMHLNGENRQEMKNAYEKMFDIILENIERGSIGNKNVDTFLSMLMKFYKKMLDTIDNRKHATKIEGSYDYLTRMHTKYHGLFCKIDDYFKYKFEVSVDCQKHDNSLSVKPIFVKESFKEISSDHNLFMSATISEVTMIETLCLDPEEVQVINMPYGFNREDKTIIINKDSLMKVNYETLQECETYEFLAEECKDISSYHKDENGIIITTSFIVAEKLYGLLKNQATHNLILHRRGEKLENVVEKFKDSVLPSILLSPSLFEGVDLEGDHSRFQILTKAPFYSLGDKRIRQIMRTHRSVYNSMTTMRLVQSLGRSTRSKGDKSTSYFLDSNLVRTFNSKHNIWKDQFHVVNIHPSEDVKKLELLNR